MQRDPALLNALLLNKNQAKSCPLKLYSVQTLMITWFCQSLEFQLQVVCRLHLLRHPHLLLQVEGFPLHLSLLSLKLKPMSQMTPPQLLSLHMKLPHHNIHQLPTSLSHLPQFLFRQAPPLSSQLPGLS